MIHYGPDFIGFEEHKAMSKCHFNVGISISKMQTQFLYSLSFYYCFALYLKEKNVILNFYLVCLK